MKELSIEQKAQRYDEAIDIARKINSGEGVAAPSGWTTCEVIFPELKESEDERIRGAIIHFISHTPTVPKGIIGKKIMIAWLEKQGEHANFRNKIQVGDKVTRSEDGMLVNLSQLNRVAKPANKIEPKFKVGDWVFIEEIKGYKQGAFQIKSIDEFGYNFDEYHIIPFMYEELLSKWTIKDAKNGDVLVCPKYAGDIIPIIFIFKNIEIKDNDVFCYCSFLKTFMAGGYVANADPINTDFYPATKEQRDTLFAKMHEAGYEWDAEKKELRQKPVERVEKK